MKLNGEELILLGMARCPAHDDKVPSLGVYVGQDNKRLVLHCFAGCSVGEILRSWGHAMGPDPHC